ncbi:hypothetical protein BDV95DRAFT_121784 [Massariosphaeria phaeospora]|uniref:Swi5-dependent recombination DNA repair protein 1 n=1 Tax=Massariosphaeria phaeospora TaxID=100035 RepID=A0A7C8I1Z3_9PLEO|nr:hypothetical protein BDV95DRAFT_121784 [Massariosphaeria phaeospora]
MSTPQAKRRRVNDATNTLRKPFKSPFRTPLKPSIGSDPPSSDPPDISTVAAAPTQSNKATNPTHAPTRSAFPLPPRPAPVTPSRSLQKKIPTKPSLTREIIHLRSDIQILSQAHALATSTTDDDLNILIDRWRTASRAAAEELFASTRDRVNRMGGVGAWKEREREQKEWRQKWDREDMEAEREKREEARQNGNGVEESYDDCADLNMDKDNEKTDEGSKGADDDSFTMGMMLKTLNIDLKLIGYDQEAQRWDG